jgi:hypothetical protein
MVRLGRLIVPRARVRAIDLTHIEALRVVARLDDGEDVALEGADAIRAVMELCPEAFEGRRLRFVRHAWAVHNLVGHPLMQLLAWLGMTRLGLRVHDATVPKPLSA